MRSACLPGKVDGVSIANIRDRVKSLGPVVAAATQARLVERLGVCLTFWKYAIRISAFCFLKSLELRRLRAPNE